LQVNVLREEEAKRVLEVHVPLDEMKPYFDEALSMYREEVQVEGFRKGKAPKEIVLKRFGNAIEAEALETIISEYYKQAIETSKTEAIAMGEISNLNYKKGEPLSFEVSVDIMPKYDLTKYKGLELTRRVHTVTPEEVDQTIQRLRENHSTVKPVDTVSPGNIVYVDIQELDESGLAIIGRRFEDRRIPLTTEYVGQDMIDGLVGAGAGETRQLNVEKRGTETGERQRFEMTVRKIEEVILPELDDEFAKDLGLENVDALRQDVEKNLRERWEKESAADLKQTLINEIVKHNDLPAPEPLVHDNIHRFIDALKARAGQQEIDEKYVHESYRGTAIRDVKWALAMKKIIEIENVKIDDDDIQRYRQRLADQHKVTIDRIAVPNADERRRLESHLLEEKIIGLIQSHATITEAPYEETAETVNEG
jgi:trigger factor